MSSRAISFRLSPALLLLLSGCPSPAPTETSQEAVEVVKGDNADKPDAAKPDAATSEEKHDKLKKSHRNRRKPKQIPPPEDLTSPPEDAIKTESGLVYRELKPGDGGDHPTMDDRVRVFFTEWNDQGETLGSTDGQVSGRSYWLSKVMPGWSEGLQLMTVGQKMRLWIPAELTLKHPRAPEGPRVVDIELASMTKAPQAPTDVAAPPADAKTTESGLHYKVLTEGTGTEHPDAWDHVRAHYSGWTTDGKLFDSTAFKGSPGSFNLGRVIPGWTEGVQLMLKGEKTRFWIPEELAYKGMRGKPQGMLVFDIELVEWRDLPEPPPPPEVPADVAAPPADAKTTASGLAYKVLKEGTGTATPTAQSRVRVHYSGWTTDGNMFDSSVVRGQPATFPLSGVIKGWTEGLQLMNVGEQTRFWIPKELAYNDMPGKPQGMLVFDVELLEVL